MVKISGVAVRDREAHVLDRVEMVAAEQAAHRVGAGDRLDAEQVAAHAAAGADSAGAGLTAGLAAKQATRCPGASVVSAGRSIAADVHRQRAARMEAAAGRRRRKVRRRAAQALALRGVADPRQALDQVLRVGMQRRGRRAPRVGASSTRRPAYMMPSRSAMLACTDMSWVTKSIEERHLALDLAHQRQHVLLHHDVERGRRLVGDDELGPADRGQRDRHALPHAARKLVRIGVEHARARRCSRSRCALDERLNSGIGLPMWRKAKSTKVLPHPADRVQHVHRALHDVGDVLPADRRRAPRRRARGCRGRGSCSATEPPTTLSGGRFAAAIVLMNEVLPELELPGQAVDLVLVDVERDVVDRPHLARRCRR